MWLAIACATAASVLSMVAVLPLLTRIALVDHPNHRSMHRNPTPRGGGLSVLVGIGAGFLVAALDGAIHIDSVTTLCVAATLVMGTLGLMDDVVGLSARVRLLAQLASGCAVATTAVTLSTSSTWVIVIAPVVGALWVAAFVNAFNFMDGINGISSLSAAVAGFWYAYLGWNLNDPALLLGGLLAGAALGFLPWNAPHARVFLGDVGSYSIGALLACLALDAAIKHDAPTAAIAPLIVYIADSGITLLKRARNGAQLTEPHREHVYQRLAGLGPSHLAVAMIVAGASALICIGVRFSVAPFAEVIAAIILLSYMGSPALIAKLRRIG